MDLYILGMSLQCVVIPTHRYWCKPSSERRLIEIIRKKFHEHAKVINLIWAVKSKQMNNKYSRGMSIVGIVLGY